MIATVLSAVYRQASIARLGPFFHALRQALRTAAPAGALGEPRVVLLTAGPDSETAFDHALAARIAATPWGWVGQEQISADDEPTAAVLRTFAVAHDGGYTVMAGGLARIGAGPLVSSSVGAVAKDVWVMASQPHPTTVDGAPEEPPEHARARGPAISPRTAENLFWMGRYTERAEDQVRVLRAVADRWDDDHAQPDGAGGRALAVLLEVLTPRTSAEGGEESAVEAPAARPAADPVLRELLLDRRLTGSVARSVLALHRTADTVRDQLSNDAFAPIARIERALRDESGRTRAVPAGAPDQGGTPGRPAVTAGLRPTLDGVLEGLLALAGVAAEGLTRDVGWHLLDAGRRVERAQHVVDTLAATLIDRRSPEIDGLVLESLLLIHESAITYRRRHPSGPSVATVLDLLVHDESNPRSVAFQLDRLRVDLEAVPIVGRPPDQRDHLLRDVADLVHELDSVTVAGALSGARRVRLAESLDSMRWRLRAAADEIGRVHFAPPAPSRAQEGIWGSDVRPDGAA